MGERFERAGAGVGEVNYGRGVVECVGPVEVAEVATQVNALGIKLLGLQDGVEHAKIGSGICAAPGHPLPTGGVVGGIGVDQSVPKPCLAHAPINQQVFDEERGGHHAHAIVHVTGLPQLAHTCIDEGNTRAAVLPCGQRGSFRRNPGETVEAAVEVGRRQGGPVKEQVVAELAPAHLGNKFGRVAQRLGGSVAPGRVDAFENLKGADLAKPQVRRQLTGGKICRHIAPVGITREPLGHERLKLLVRGLLSHCPTRRQSGRPVGMLRA